MRKGRKSVAGILGLVLMVALLTGCGGTNGTDNAGNKGKGTLQNPYTLGDEIEFTNYFWTIYDEQSHDPVTLKISNLEIYDEVKAEDLTIEGMGLNEDKKVLFLKFDVEVLESDVSEPQYLDWSINFSAISSDGTVDGYAWDYGWENSNHPIEDGYLDFENYESILPQGATMKFVDTIWVDKDFDYQYIAIEYKTNDLGKDTIYVKVQ